MKFLKFVSISLLLINPLNVLAQYNDYSAEEIIMRMEVALNELIETHQIKEISSDDRKFNQDMKCAFYNIKKDRSVKTKLDEECRNLYINKIQNIERHPLNYLPEKILSNAEYDKQKQDKELIKLINQYLSFECCQPFISLDKDEERESRLPGAANANIVILNLK